MSRSRSKHYAVRICLLGEAGCGKSSFFYRVKHKAFRDNPEELDRTRTISGGPNSRTRFYESYTTVLRPDSRTKINLTLMDTGSRERYQSLTAQYYNRANVIILVCSLDSEYTLNCLAKWHTEAQYYIDSSNIIYAVMATKADLPEVEREVTMEHLENFASHLDIPLEYVFQVSSLTGENVNEVLKKTCNAVVRQYSERGGLSQELNEASLLLRNGANGLPVPINEDGIPQAIMYRDREQTCCCVPLYKSSRCVIL